MALKGTTRIELTDVKTGEVEVIEKHNLVTNAVSDILSCNPFGMRFRGYSNSSTGEIGDNFQKSLLPVVPNLIGGILLYEKELASDAAAYYADMSNPIVGYANNSAHTTNDSKRGDMNTIESGKLDGGSGYRFVFDFNTSQGNGTISALGLTSARGGQSAHGSAYIVPPNCLGVDYSTATASGAWVSTPNIRRLASIVSIDTAAKKMYGAVVTGAKTISLIRADFDPDAIGLFDAYAVNSFNNLAETVITASGFGTVGSDTNKTTYSTLVDGGDGYIWGFQHANNANGNSSGSATVTWIKIDKTDWSFTEGTWSIAAQLYQFGEYATTGTSNYATMRNNVVISNGVLYALKYDQKGVYKLPLNNPSDVSLLECSFVINATPSSTSSGSGYIRNYVGTSVNIVAGTICYKNAYIQANTLHNRSATTYSTGNPTTHLGLHNCAKPGLYVGPYLIGFSFGGSSGSSSQVQLMRDILLPMTYLATINNLDTPVTKTADKTMKITYILREE